MSAVIPIILYMDVFIYIGSIHKIYLAVVLIINLLTKINIILGISTSTYLSETGWLETLFLN